MWRHLIEHLHERLPDLGSERILAVHIIHRGEPSNVVSEKVEDRLKVTTVERFEHLVDALLRT